MRRAALAAVFMTVAIVAACTPQPRPGSPYEICNATGCGDNVVFVIDNATE